MNTAESSRLLLVGAAVAFAVVATVRADDAAPTAPPAPTTPASPGLPEGPKALQIVGPPATGGKPTDFIVDAMVGQVNGHAIYASEIYRSIGEETLRRIGEVEPRLVFKARASELIASKLRERVTNTLILAEAERGLSEREMLGLLAYVKQQREKVLAEYGGGVLAIAEERLQHEKGHGVDDELEQFRQMVLVDKFKREKLFPKVSINRREVEHYYNDHFDDFNPNPRVTLRVISVPDARTADEVDAELKSGKKFADVADDFTEGSKRGGLMGPFPLAKPMSEFAELKWASLNEKARTLAEGQRSDRAKTEDGYGWVMIDKLEGGKGRTLTESFLDIENRLRAAKFNKLFSHYLMELTKSGNFTPLDQMGNALIDIAMVRYARQK